MRLLWDTFLVLLFIICLIALATIDGYVGQLTGMGIILVVHQLLKPKNKPVVVVVKDGKD